MKQLKIELTSEHKTILAKELGIVCDELIVQIADSNERKNMDIKLGDLGEDILILSFKQ